MDGVVTDQSESPGRSIIQSITGTIREDLGEFVLLAFIGIIIIYGVYESSQLMEQSRMVPMIILGCMTVVFFATIVMKFFGETIKEKVGLIEDDPGFEFEAESEETSDDMSLYNLNPPGVALHSIWLVFYLISLTYVGFWTTNVVFPIVYIMIYDESEINRRIPYALLWTGLIVAVLWVLFVELLLVQAIWRLGFLP